MAFSFDGVNQSLSAGSAVVTTDPLTMVAWGKSNSVLANQLAIGVGRSGSVQDRIELQWAGASGGKIRLQVEGAGLDQISSTTAYSSGVWNHGAAVLLGPSSRAVYLDGGSKDTSTNTITPSGADRTFIGVRISNGAIPFDGDLADVAIWNVALTDAEIAWLAKGFSPLTLTHRLGNLVFYRDLIRGLNRPGIGPTLTNNNGATVANHPPIIYPSPAIIGIPVAAAGGATVVPFRRRIEARAA